MNLFIHSTAFSNHHPLMIRLFILYTRPMPCVHSSEITFVPFIIHWIERGPLLPLCWMLNSAGWVVTNTSSAAAIETSHASGTRPQTTYTTQPCSTLFNPIFWYFINDNCLFTVLTLNEIFSLVTKDLISNCSTWFTLSSIAMLHELTMLVCPDPDINRYHCLFVSWSALCSRKEKATTSYVSFIKQRFAIDSG